MRRVAVAQANQRFPSANSSPPRFYLNAVQNRHLPIPLLRPSGHRGARRLSLELGEIGGEWAGTAEDAVLEEEEEKEEIKVK